MKIIVTRFYYVRASKIEFLFLRREFIYIHFTENWYVPTPRVTKNNTSTSSFEVSIYLCGEDRAQRKEPPFFNLRAVVRCEIMRSKDVRCSITNDLKSARYTLHAWWASNQSHAIDSNTRPKMIQLELGNKNGFPLISNLTNNTTRVFVYDLNQGGRALCRTELQKES